MVLPDRLEEVLIRLPKNLFIEVNGMAKHENKDINDLIYQATKNYVQYKKEIRQLHESMQKGYEEMARINLNLCSEAFLAEEEAKNTLDRLVIGV
ncbi:antitoxin [Pseudogracilibacillus auburnensis]|uniref:antitoxin n=1 Tax=Pseudogracilibacillus auburnensis TaxID=1494959 RepID=UPI000D75298F|nr:antitoxin [Pseudogracilibacillus auburnensis]MBO1002436.1 antitoxin [Pseudogracilibacillus auburnensis]